MDFNAEQRQLLARHELLIPLLSKTIIADAVAGISLSEEQSELALASWCKRKGFSPAQEKLDKYCLVHRISEADLRWQAELPLRIVLHGQKNFGHRAEQRFLERKTQLDKVIYSLIRVQDHGLAQELYLQISGGENSFSDLASEHSQGPEKNTQGIVGPTPLTKNHPKVVEILRSGQDGQLFAPIRIEPWSLIIRRESLQPAVFNEQTKIMMTQELFDSWVNEELESSIRQN
ncbi:peptidylprolyl isomerase [Synechococcus sp. AH-229-G18]|nr:peptidylprolyl isomerase [Synechococcus sp. AH-229-G18]